MTDEERKNRNPAPEMYRTNFDEAPELLIKDLEPGRVYILLGEQRPVAVTFNYIGSFQVFGRTAYRFAAPRIRMMLVLFERPDDPGALEDGRGIKVTILKYTGPDA